jgi:hypothetical protein
MGATSALAGDARTTLPLCIVYGNCQADALSHVLRASPAFAAEYNIACVPAVHTITATERSELEKLVARASLIVAQPVKRGYREMALGTDEITAAAPSRCRVICFPVQFYPPLYPFQVVVHLNGGRSVDAPMTKGYHDLRVVSRSARGMGLDAALDWLESYVPDPATLRQIAARAAANIRERERETDIAVFDRFTASATSHRASFFTINHPARLTLRCISEGVHSALDIPFDDIGGTELLDIIKTPLEGSVVNALGLPGRGTRRWVIDGKRVFMKTVVRAHLDFYRRRPDVVAAALNEYAARLANLALVNVRGHSRSRS